MTHQPVLTKEILEYLNPKPNENFIDATVGEAGHTLEILKRTGPNGVVLGIDLDTTQAENSKLAVKEFKDRAVIVNDSYTNIKNIVERENIHPINGILLDLGMSSWQLENSKRGFSFLKDEPLDMRYSLHNTLTAEKIVNEYPEDEIRKIIEEYGEEKFAKSIAKAIAKEREVKKIKTTFELRGVIASAIPKRNHNSRLHYATRTFQALRIAVNKELENVNKVLAAAYEILSNEGRLVVLSFHSLEDRIVKNFFNTLTQEGKVKILTKKPIMASESEVQINPRARSAKLRAIIKY